MTPATFGPIACISRKFCGFACRPILLATRAAMGTAETPAAPISGLTALPVTRYITLPINTPAAVPIENATMPSRSIPRVSALRNLSAASLEPTARPRKIVTMLINSFCAVLLRRSTTPHSRIKFPKQSMPINGVAEGSNRIATSSRISGNRIFSSLVTRRNWVILVWRSSSVVSAIMIGGWMIGTRAM